MAERRITNYLLWLGFLPSQLLIVFIYPTCFEWVYEHGLLPWIAAVWIAGYLLALIGCFLYALDKGWPVWVGALGIFHWIGFGVLYQLPVRPVSKKAH
jgi:hypothetical protein